MSFERETKGGVRGRCLFFLPEDVGGGLLTDGVSDRRAYAKHIAGVKPEIVLDVVVVSLGTHKDVGQMVPNVIAEASADVLHEVIAAGVVNASRGGTGGKDVEAVAGNADAGQKVEANFLGYSGLVEGVDVGKERPVIFVTVIARLLKPPGSFNVKAETMPEGHYVAAEAEVGSACFGQGLEGHYVAGGSKRLEDAAADQDIALLLGRGEVGKQQNGTCGCEQREFSQYKSLVSSFGLPKSTRQGRTLTTQGRVAATST
jgi:hypothetical protein